MNDYSINIINITTYRRNTIGKPFTAPGGDVDSIFETNPILTRFYDFLAVWRVFHVFWHFSADHW